MYKKRLSLLLLLALVAVGTFGGSCRKANTVPTIGADLTTTGVVGFWGESVQRGMQLAQEEYARRHPDKPVNVLYQDNQGDPKTAVSIMRKFASVDKVAVVVSTMTPFSVPLRPLAAEFKTPLLGTIVVKEGFGQENEWSFRDYPTPEQLSARIAEYSYKKGLRRAVSLVVNDEYGKDGEAVFKTKFESLGGALLGSDTMAQKDTDARTQITKLLAQKPDCVLLVIRDNALGTAVRQFRELGFKGQILGINAFDSPIVWQAAGQTGEGTVFSSAFIDYEKNGDAAAFAQAYKARYNEEPSHSNAYGYSIGLYLMELAAQANGDPVKMRELLSTLDQNSIRGQVKMLPSRDVTTAVAVFQRSNGHNVFVEK
jgi:branched-chain amino acid transport system substrate-binding protein